VTPSRTLTLPSATGTADLHREMLPQKDNLCGPFWGSLVLRAHGVDADQDAVALAAGTILPAGGEPDEWLPRGAAPRDDYRIDLPRSDDRSVTGTSATGLARAIERLSAGALTVTAVPAPLTAGQLEELLESAAARDAFVIANLDTGPLWGTHPSQQEVLDFLSQGRDTGPPTDWAVGHFANPIGLTGSSGGTMVVVRDTYGQMGEDGRHLQPIHRFLRAIDGRGLLVVAETAFALPAGIAPGLWDNGTPDRGKEDGTT